jgi:hypothetical protein
MFGVRIIGRLTITDDVVPLVDRSGRTCQEYKAVQVPYNSRKVSLQFTALGGASVEHVKLYYAKWDDIPVDKLDCVTQPDLDVIKTYFKEAEIKGDTSGSTRWDFDNANTPFTGFLDISDGSYASLDKLVVLASARFDQAWGKQQENASPHVPPQSHIVNARTNSTWYHESDGTIIQGRVDWFSTPLTIILGNYEDLIKEQTVKTIELSARFDEPTKGTTADDSNESPPLAQSSNDQTPATGNSGASLATLLIVAACISICLFIGGFVLKKRLRDSNRSRVRDFIDDHTVANPGLKRRTGYEELELSEMT